MDKSNEVGVKRGPGRPVTGQAMTAAERQRASRQKRKAETCDSFPAQTVSVMLSPEAAKALRMLSIKSDMSRKLIIERLLVEAYNKSLQ